MITILEKLRSEITHRKEYYKSKLSTSNTTKQTADDKILMVRINELEIVLFLLTSLKYKEKEGGVQFVPPLGWQSTTGEVIVPEFNYSKLEEVAIREGGGDNVLALAYAVDRIGEQTEKITQWIHSQSNK